MVVFSVKMNVLKGKKKEFEQTALDLIGKFKKQHGCLEYCLFKQIDDQDVYVLTGKWKEDKSYKMHVNGYEFSLLCGAIECLCEKPMIEVLEPLFLGNIQEFI